MLIRHNFKGTISQVWFNLVQGKDFDTFSVKKAKSSTTLLSHTPTISAKKLHVEQITSLEKKRF